MEISVYTFLCHPCIPMYLHLCFTQLFVHYFTEKTQIKIKAQQHTDRVPIKEILRERPMSRLRSRRHFVIEAARLANLSQTEQETWEQSWIQGVPPGHDIVTNPTCPQPGSTLSRRQFVTLNRLRCGQARCAESLHRWGVIASPACPCGESHHTTRHIVEEYPLTAFPGGLQRLHQAGPGAEEWLSRLLCFPSMLYSVKFIIPYANSSVACFFLHIILGSQSEWR